MPRQHLVHRAPVNVVLWLLAVLAWVEMDARELRVQLLRLRRGHHHRVDVKPRTLQEQAVDNASLLGARRLAAGNLENVEVKRQGIDGNLVLPRVVLERAGEERLREVETRDPERLRDAVVDPVAQELEALQQLDRPRGKRLQRRVALRLPDTGHTLRGHGVTHVLELRRHDHETLERLLDVDERAVHDDKELVVPDALLHKHSVHRLLVLDRVHHLDLLNVEHRWQVLQDALRHIGNELLARLAAAARTARLQGEHNRERIDGLVVVARDVCVGVHAEDLGIGVQRQRVQVLNVAVVRVLGIAVDRVVETGRRELVTRLHGLRTEVVQEDNVNCTKILVVRHSPAIIDVRGEEVQHLVGHLIVVVEEDLKLLARDFQVRLVELVRHVPSQRPKLLALLHIGVEERKSEEQLLEQRRLIR
mmetsp:Transcript_53888/g.129849  ORF Transcript_53888/g.129849 Transcript_53888/m.129849 type:complete len:420 (+) Transcript_53888:262-1521(+)